VHGMVTRWSKTFVWMR